MNATTQLLQAPAIASAYAAIENKLPADGQPNPAMRLHCNETPFDLPLELKQQIATKMAELAWNRYPDFYNTELTALVAENAGVQPENVVLGNGSSQLIQQIFHACATFLSVAVIENPTFTFYHQACQNARMTSLEYALSPDGSYNLDAFPAINEPALVVLTSPNNPMGSTLPREVLETLLQQYPQCIFVVDEAYAEFANESAVELVKQYTNLMVLKTLSKGYSLPGIRFGYVVGCAALMQLLRKHTVPFTINIFTEVVVRELLTNPAVANALRLTRERVKNLRDFVHFLLQDLATDTDTFTVLPSVANFLLLRFHDAEPFEQVKRAFANRGILVSYPMPNCLRLTIGTEVEMNQVVRLLKHTLVQCRCLA